MQTKSKLVGPLPPNRIAGAAARRYDVATYESPPIYQHHQLHAGLPRQQVSSRSKTLKQVVKASESRAWKHSIAKTRPRNATRAVPLCPLRSLGGFFWIKVPGPAPGLLRLGTSRLHSDWELESSTAEQSARALRCWGFSFGASTLRAASNSICLRSSSVSFKARAASERSSPFREALQVRTEWCEARRATRPHQTQESW